METFCHTSTSMYQNKHRVSGDCVDKPLKMKLIGTLRRLINYGRDEIQNPHINSLHWYKEDTKIFELMFARNLIHLTEHNSVTK